VQLIGFTKDSGFLMINSAQKKKKLIAIFISSKLNEKVRMKNG
jgi:hypothetical protein